MSPSRAIDLLPDICEYLGVDYAVVTERTSRGRMTKKPEAVAARYILTVYLCDVARMSFPECAEALGYRSHASTLSHYHVAKALGITATPMPRGGAA